MPQIIITGSTGNLGSRTLKHLFNLIQPSEIIVSVFNPENAAHDALRQKGVEVRQGDFNNPATLESAFKGADKLFLVSVPSFEDELRFLAHKNAIDAAKAVGVKHIYYTSLAIASTSTAGVMQAHLRTEAYLKASGVKYTIIREGIYFETYPTFLGFFKPTDTEVLVPGNGGIPLASVDDLAIANAKLLVSDEYVNQTVNLTGPKIQDLAELTSILAEHFRHKIDFKIVSEEEWLAHNADKVHAKPWISTYPALAKGDWAFQDPLLEKLVGRPLETFEQRLKALLSGQEQLEEMHQKHDYNT